MIDRKKVVKILSGFRIGELKRLGRVIKDDHASYCRIVYSEQGKFLLKIYRIFSKHTETGLNLVQTLSKKKFPTNGLVLTRSGNPYLCFEGHRVSMFRFIEEREKLHLTTKEVGELGKWLGRLHKLTLNFKSQQGRFSYDHFAGLSSNHFKSRKQAPKHIQRILEYVHENLPKTKCSRRQPKAANHVEFTPEHVRFKNGKLRHIIDWDEINKDYCFYDLGTAMIACFTKTKLDYNKLKIFIVSYTKERPLTQWEHEHIFEALQYGCFKFCIWTLTDPRTDKLKVKYKWPEDVDRVKMLMQITADEFYKKLEEKK